MKEFFQRVGSVERCKACGDYQHWRGMANANGIKNLAMKELRGALGKLKLK